MNEFDSMCERSAPGQTVSVEEMWRALCDVANMTNVMPVVPVVPVNVAETEHKP